MALFSRPGANSAAAAGETLSGNVTLNDNDVFILRYNPNGSNWTIKDRASHRKHRGRILQNSGSSGNLLLTDKADNAIATVAPGESIMYGGTGSTIAYVPMNETTIPALNLGDSDPLNLGDGPDLVLQHNGTNSLITNATGELQIDSAGALSLESSAGAINVGADAVNQAINIGTAGTRTVTVGSSAASLAIDAPTATTSTVTTTDGVTAGPTRRVGGRVDVDTASGASHTGSTDEFILTSYTIPANTIKAGTVVKVRFGARVTADNGTTTLTGRLRFGDTTLTGTELIVTAAVDTSSGHWFSGEFTLIGRAAPAAAASIAGVGSSYLGAVGASGAAPVQQALAPTNYATDGALLLELTADWSAADANAVQSEVWSVEIIG